MKISARQKDVLLAVEAFIEKHKYAPSMREISDAVGWSSTGTTHQCLTVLKHKGFIQWEPSKPRTLKVVKNAYNHG